MKIKQFLIFLSFFAATILCRGNTITIITDRIGYTNSDTAQFSIHVPFAACYDYPLSVYVTLRNSKQEQVQRLNILMKEEKINGFIPLAILDSGFYFLTAYILTTGSAEHIYSNMVCVAVNMPDETIDLLSKPLIRIYPEGGKALVGYTNKIAVFLQTLSGNPLSEKIYLRNRQNQLMATCQPNTMGWGVINLPVVDNDTIRILDFRGTLIKTLFVSTDSLFSNNSFTIHVLEDQHNLVVEVVKAQNAEGSKVIAEMYFQDKLLADAELSFREDTTIVVTSFPLTGFENRLLYIVLKDEKGFELTERYYYVNKSVTPNEKQKIPAELFCNTRIEFPPYLTSSAKGNLEAGLIALQRRKENKQPGEPETGFTIFMHNPMEKNKEVNYSIYSANNELLQIGTATTDREGIIHITGCGFKGNVFIRLYENKKELTGFQVLIAPLSSAEKSMMNSILSELENNYAGLPAIQKEINNADFARDALTLQNITVQSEKKSRISELDDKYVRNGMFKSRNGTQVNVEDDPMAVNYSVMDYLLKNIPGLMIRNNIFRYKMGYIEFYIDEMLVSDISGLSINDIGYIKFFSTPVGSGFSAQRGGAMLRGDSFAAGLQGSVAIYTKKSSDLSWKQNGFSGLMVTGYEN